MWLRKSSNYLLSHPVTALVIMFLLTSITVIDAFKTMPLIFVLLIGSMLTLVTISYAGLVTLMQGILWGGVFFIAVTLPLVLKLILLFQSSTPVDLMIIIGIVFSCLLNLVIWVIASLLRKGYSWSIISQGVTLLGVFTLSLIALFYPQLTEWWITVLQKPMDLANAATISGQQVITPDMQQKIVDYAARVATGVMTAGLILCALLQVMVSRGWQGFLVMPGLLKNELANFHLSKLTGLLFALAVLISSLGDFYPEYNNDLITTIMPVVYMLFVLAGLNLIHYFFGMIAFKARIFWLLFFYIFFIYMAPFSIVMVAMIALFDIWIDFRKRFPSA